MQQHRQTFFPFDDVISPFFAGVSRRKILHVVEYLKRFPDFGGRLSGALDLFACAAACKRTDFRRERRKRSGFVLHHRRILFDRRKELAIFVPQNVGCLSEVEAAYFVRIKRVELRLYFGGSGKAIDTHARFEIKPGCRIERRIDTVCDVSRRFSASRIGRVFDIVVDETRRMHEFDKRRKRIRFVFGENSAAAVKRARVFGTQHE